MKKYMDIASDTSKPINDDCFRKKLYHRYLILSQTRLLFTLDFGFELLLLTPYYWLFWKPNVRSIYALSP